MKPLASRDRDTPDDHATARQRVVVVGATGRTGNAVAHGLADADSVELVACVSPSAAAAPTRLLPEGPERSPTLDDVEAAFDVMVDLTNAEVARDSVERALARGVHVVLGTTGLDEAWLAEMGDRFAEHRLGLLYAPNFSIGALLMMRYAADAARYLPGVEILEIHRAGKLDAPSGTARRTAQLVADARSRTSFPALRDGRHDSAALGEVVDGVPVHSMRLKGSVAHQQVVLGGPGEMLTIRHDALDRSCYAAGVELAVRRVVDTTGLTMGLEQLL